MHELSLGLQRLPIFKPDGIVSRRQRLAGHCIRLIPLTHSKLRLGRLHRVGIRDGGAVVGQHALQRFDADTVTLQASVGAPNAAVQRDAQHDLFGWGVLQSVADGLFDERRAGYRTGGAPLPALVVGHDHQIVGVLGQPGIVVRAVPAGSPPVGVGRHCHRYLFARRQALPQNAHQLRIGIAVGGGDVFDIDIHPVEAVGIDGVDDLPGQFLRVLQGPLAGGAIPVVAEHGNHLDAHLVHGVDQRGTDPVERELSLGADIEVAGRHGVEISNSLHLGDLLGDAAAVQVGHVKFIPRAHRLLYRREHPIGDGGEVGALGQSNRGGAKGDDRHQQAGHHKADGLDLFLTAVFGQIGRQLFFWFGSRISAPQVKAELRLSPGYFDNQVVPAVGALCKTIRIHAFLPPLSVIRMWICAKNMQVCTAGHRHFFTAGGPCSHYM